VHFAGLRYITALVISYVRTRSKTGYWRKARGKDKHDD